MLLVDTYIAPSPVEGLGVFAAEPIAKGSTLWVLDRTVDTILTRAQLAERPEVYQRFIERYAYFDTSIDAFLLDGDNARFLNHSGTPNLGFFGDGTGVATADIAVGSEIFCDYSHFMDEFVLLPSKCQAHGHAASL